MSAAPADWDARTYHRVSTPHQEWGPAVMDRLALRGDEVVLDAGCGSGRVTRLLAERLPRGRVIAVDASEAMVAEAREGLADLGARVSVRRVDLLALDLEEEVDAVFSSAVFHWIADHERLFGRLYAALRPGGRLSVQCGGAGNVAAIIAAHRAVEAEDPYASAMAPAPDPWCFADAPETLARLEALGFAEVQAWLEPDEVWLEAGEEAERYLATIVLRERLSRLPDALREGFTRAVAERLTTPEGRVRFDYVRLNVNARRPR